MISTLQEAREFSIASEGIAKQWKQFEGRFRNLTKLLHEWELPEEEANLKKLGDLKRTMMGLEAEMEAGDRRANTLDLMLTGATLTLIAVTSLTIWRFREAPNDLVKLVYL